MSKEDTAAWIECQVRNFRRGVAAALESMIEDDLIHPELTVGELITWLRDEETPL